MKVEPELLLSNISAYGKHFEREVIIINVPTFHAHHNLFFTDCLFILLPSLVTQYLHITSDDTVRFSNCRFQCSVVIRGNAPNALDRSAWKTFGPNVFFERCKWFTFTHQEQEFPPILQISGVVGQVQSTDPEGIPSLKVSQARFDDLSIMGSYSTLEFQSYAGETLRIRNADFKNIWIRDRMASSVPTIEIDETSLRSICSALQNGISHSPSRSALFLMEALSSQMEGEFFLMVNDAFCKTVNADTITKFIFYRIFKNFYAIMPLVLVSIAVVLLFFFVYSSQGQAWEESAIESILAFTGNPKLDISNRILIYSKIAEQTIGIILIVMLGWVVSRKYSSHR